MPPTVDLYIRVSRVGGRENLISPDEQERRARKLATERSLNVGEVIVDLDESGGKWERPGLQRALQRVEAGDTQGVIVAWLDRLSRDSEHAHALVRRITQAGGTIYAPDAPADWTSPEGELQAGILFEFAAYVRKRARASFERAKEQAIQRGIPIHTRPPAGYRARGDRRLEPDPASADVVRAVFDARLRGAGPAELAELLEAGGVTTSQGSRTWSKEAVYGLLRNRTYLGEVAYGKDRRFVNVAAHEPIVDLATWQLAQGRVARPAHGRAHLLSGLLRCDGCRHSLQGTTDAHGHRIYRCKRRHAGGICQRPARNRQEPIEEAVLADMWAHMPTIRATAASDPGGRLTTLAQQAERDRAALAQWASPAVQQEIGDLDVYVEGLRARRDQANRSEAALAAEQQLAKAAHAFPATISWADLWDGMSVTDRAGLVATRYDCIRLGRNPDLLIVYPAGTGPHDLPQRGYRRTPVLRGFEGDVPAGARVLTF